MRADSDSPVDQETLGQLTQIVGRDFVATEHERIVDYLADETGPPVRPQAAVAQAIVKPGNATEVAEILRLANAKAVPVFPRGGGTGLCGGAVPTLPGIVLSTERLKSLHVDKDNLMAVVGAGVTLGELTGEVELQGLFFPPHPGDESAMVGGLVACNAGGARALKYGVMRNYVKGMEIALSSGELLTLGGKLIKDNTGLDLMHLVVGSEGTLCVITGVSVRLHARPACTRTMVVPFKTRRSALSAVPVLLRSGVLPLAIEYIERELAELAAAHVNLDWPCRHGSAYLIVILDGRGEEDVNYQCRSIEGVCRRYGCLEPIIGQTKKEQERVLRIRSNVYPALKRDLCDALDVAVPPASLCTLMDAIDEIAKEFGTVIPVCGHAGDGNLHPTLMRDLLDAGEDRVRQAKKAVYEEALRLRGTMTGEHGVGKIRVDDLDLFVDSRCLDLMRLVKHAFDPKGILNPGCILPQG